MGSWFWEGLIDGVGEIFGDEVGVAAIAVDRVQETAYRSNRTTELVISFCTLFITVNCKLRAVTLLKLLG